jgi:transposase
VDLGAFADFYSKDLRGQPPFSVEMMTTLLVYSYSVGVFSSRKITSACERNLAFLAIVGNDRPDFRTISDFRKNHQAAMKPLFLEVLRVAGELGMVRLGNLSTDGTKIEANASRHKAMSYGYSSGRSPPSKLARHELRVHDQGLAAAAGRDRQAAGERRPRRCRTRRGLGEPSR